MGRTDEADLIVGVDTHLGTHTDDLRRARPRGVPTADARHRRGLRAATGLGEHCCYRKAGCVGDRGHRQYGLGLARHLTAAGQQVAETGSTRHVGKRRAGKSDPIDAVRAARELLARPRPAQMRADGDREALRMLMTGPGQRRAILQDRTHRAGISPGHRTR